MTLSTSTTATTHSTTVTLEKAGPLDRYTAQCAGCSWKGTRSGSAELAGTEAREHARTGSALTAQELADDLEEREEREALERAEAVALTNRELVAEADAYRATMAQAEERAEDPAPAGPNGWQDTCEGGDSYTDFDGGPGYAECTSDATSHVRYLVVTPMCAEDEEEQVAHLCGRHAAAMATDPHVRLLADSLDTLSRGLPVELCFRSPELGNPERTELHIFLAERGEGEGRHLTFTDSEESYTWDAYRFEGAWVYGTGAEPLELVRVRYDLLGGGQAPDCDGTCQGCRNDDGCYAEPGEVVRDGRVVATKVDAGEHHPAAAAQLRELAEAQAEDEQAHHEADPEYRALYGGTP